jgi:3-isopropylmalate/(R)-2-methylmalate dehydratase large subunit
LAKKSEKCVDWNRREPVVNIIEKILARASDREQVRPGEIVEARINSAMVHDITGPLTVESWKKLEETKVWDPDRIVVIFDHFLPPPTEQAAKLQKMMRDFVDEQGIRNFYDIGRGGVCHQVMPEKGHVHPGDVIVGADSHTCTYGAFGAFSTGIGSTEMAAVFSTGHLWFKVPRTIRINVTGSFAPFVMAKDLILQVLGKLGVSGANYRGIEFTGQTVEDMSVAGRMTLCNMSIEAGAKTGVVAPDVKTAEYLGASSSNSFESLRSDGDSAYERTIEIDASTLSPQVARPHSPDNVAPIEEIPESRVDQAFLGSCTNGRTEDLRIAAKILDGKRVHDHTRLIVTPASQDVYQNCLEEGLLEIFTQSGAIVTNPGCGICIGIHLGVLAPGDVCVSSSNRNFVGRMGSPQAKIFLASPATVAASAITGRITDPRKLS